VSKFLPPAFLSSLENLPGFNKNAFVQTHRSGEQVVSVRMNPAKHLKLNTQHTTFQKVPWSSAGYYLPERPSFTADPLFHAGAYYVQEASSMFLEEVMKQTCDLTKPIRVLDLCAAPGGKSTLILSLITADSLLLSNEVIKPRVNSLIENITRSGAPNVIVSNNDPRDFKSLQSFFDLIVVDAPCSGSGLFRKDPAAINEWSLQNVEHCSLRQHRILTDIFSSLKPGGILIYSTCSYSECENEEITDWIMNHSLASLRIRLDPCWNVVESLSAHKAYGYRFYPDKVKGEGFFIAAFKREDDVDISRQPVNKDKLQLLTQNELNIIKTFVDHGLSLHYIKWKDDVLALPGGVFDNLGLIQSNLYLKKAGINIGSIIRNELIPSHELAMSTILNNNLPFIETDKATASKYLRRQELNIVTSLTGWVLLKYNKLPIGWIKILPNRINNYYPKEWRILNK